MPRSSGSEQERVLRRILEYNEDDRRAMAHIKDWFVARAERGKGDGGGRAPGIPSGLIVSIRASPELSSI